jgi:hypothetical protein
MTARRSGRTSRPPARSRSARRSPAPSPTATCCQAASRHHLDEAAFWLPGHEALLLGDSVLGYDDGVRLCPESWGRKDESREELRASVERALERGPRLLLLTHGGPRQSSEASL